MENESRMHDISRLYEALGLDPVSYVSFDKQPGKPMSKTVSVPSSRTAGGREEAVSGVSLQGGEERSVTQLPRRPVAPDAQRAANHRAVQPMQLVMLSPSGGSGKTTLAAALGNALRERPHTVLLADYSLYNTLQTLFALPGDALRRVSFGIGTRTTAPLPILSRYQQGQPIPDFDSWFQSLIARTEFTLVDGLTDALAEGRAYLEKGARILIPVLPEAMSAMSAVTLDKALSSAGPSRLTYILNRFDADQASHREVRSWLRENLGTRLLPFEIPNDPTLRELASGTVVLNDLPPYLSIRLAMESLVDLLERCGEQLNRAVWR